MERCDLHYTPWVPKAASRTKHYYRDSPKLPVQYNIAVADMHKKLKMDGVLKDFLKKGD
jgi:hypothetical protein